MIRGTARDGARIHELSTSPGGTGNLTLAGAVAKFRSFSSVVTVTNDSFFYMIYNDHASRHEWEVGEGRITGATTFVRDTVFSSSNGGSKTNFTNGDTLHVCLIQQDKYEKALDLALWGDGSDGASSPSSGTVVLTDHAYFTDYTPSGTSVLDIGTGNYWIHCTGTMDLRNAPAGAITGDGRGRTVVSLDGDNGGAGGGGGAASGAAGGGGNANGTGGTGNGGSASPERLKRVPFGPLGLLKNNGDRFIGGAAGGPGGSEFTATHGSGGGVLVVAARCIHRDGTMPTGVIRSRGTAGGNAATAGGPGGGGGGWIIVLYEQLLGSTAANALQASGGAGGNGAGNGEGGGGGAGGRITLINVHTGVITESGPVSGSNGTTGSPGSGGAGGVRLANL